MAAESWTRADIRAFQVAQTELLKWKFAICGVVGAAGFGFLTERPQGSVLALAVLPWIAWYADALYRDWDLRIGTLTAFIRAKGTESHEYESFLMDEPPAHNFWMLGGVALALPTGAICTAIGVVGTLGLLGKLQEVWAVPSMHWMAWASLVVSGLGALVASLLISLFHGVVYNRMNTRAKELKNAREQLNDTGSARA
jgi:hypothetical protein